MSLERKSFYFADVFERTDREAVCFFDDSWFFEPSSVLNPGLRTMSLSMSMAFFPSARKGGDHTKSLINAKALLSDLEFGHFQANDDYYRIPDTDSIGIGIAHRVLEDPSQNQDGEGISLILICFRGAGYGDEWASNIIMGTDGPAEGFAKGRDTALSFLQNYLREHADVLTGRVKYWITGYSRVAAVANLLGAWLDDHAEEFRTCSEDIFTYTFESPLCSDYRDTTPHDCIHNTVNPFDMVPMIPPKEWGFDRYGKDDTVLPAGGSALYKEKIEEVKRRLHDLNPYIPYASDSFRPMFQHGGAIRAMEECSDLSGKARPAEWWFHKRQDEYLEHMIHFMSLHIVKGSDLKECSPAERRRQFCSFHQDAFAEGARVYMGASWDDREDMRKTLESVMENIPFRQQATMYGLLYLNNRLSYFLFERYFGRLLEKKVKEHPNPQMDIPALRKFGKAVHPMMRYFVKAASRDVRRNSFAYLSTLVENLDRITAAHCPEVTLAWMQTLDPLYH